MILPPERPGHPAPPDVIKARAGLAEAVAEGRWRTQLPPLESILGGIRVLRFQPESPSRARLLHFHGGGYRMGAPEMEGPFAAALAERCKLEIIVPQYRLAPEHPFPAGLRDALAVLEALPNDLPQIVSGGSAGGGIATALGLLAPNFIAGVLLISPWLDLTVSARSYESNAASDPLFSGEAARTAAALYLQGEDPRHPLASPLHADLTRLPSTLALVGDGEVLLDEVSDFCAKAPVARLHVVPGMLHTGVSRDLAAPGSAEAMNALGTFIGQVI